MTAATSRTHPLDSTVLRRGIVTEITPESVREQVLRLIEFHCPWAYPTLADNVSPDGDKELSIFCLSTESGEYALEIRFVSTAHNLVRDGLQPIGGGYLWVTARFGRVYGKAREWSWYNLTASSATRSFRGNGAVPYALWKKLHKNILDACGKVAFQVALDRLGLLAQEEPRSKKARTKGDTRV
jgi:hypothetical protein